MALRSKDQLSYNGGMALQVSSFRALIELSGNPRGDGVRYRSHSVRCLKWWQRDSVPAEWWSPVLATDVAFKSKVKAETLIKLAARSSETV